VEIIGWIGSVCFALSGIPQAWKCYKSGHSRGLSWGFLGLWFVGEIFTLIYIVPTGNVPLIFNYSFNFLVLTVLLRYKIWERKGGIR
jgi:uncharacterized protein with PQ loop repeat